MRSIQSRKAGKGDLLFPQQFITESEKRQQCFTVGRGKKGGEKKCLSGLTAGISSITQFYPT